MLRQKHVCVLMILLLGIFLGTIASAGDDAPFWTEKSAWVEGDELRVTGLASHAK